MCQDIGILIFMLTVWDDERFPTLCDCVDLLWSGQLLCDEYEQKTCRMKELEKKLEEIRKAQGEILSGTHLTNEADKKAVVGACMLKTYHDHK